MVEKIVESQAQNRKVVESQLYEIIVKKPAKTETDAAIFLVGSLKDIFNFVVNIKD